MFGATGKWQRGALQAIICKRSSDMTDQNLVRDIRAFLRERERGAGRPPRVDLIETHFAWVFLTSTEAYKLKKAVSQSRRMDYRTVAGRRRGCRDELLLNRRLAGTVYRAVLPVTRRRNGALVLGQPRGARIVDWVVRMRRLPGELMLDRALAAGTVRGRDLQRVERRLEEFFATAVARPLDTRGYLARMRSLTQENHRDLIAADLGLDRTRVERLTGLQLAFIESQSGALGARGALLIDGHGDLRPEHVYLGSDSDEPCVIDCLEFDRDLRRLDPAEEIAFLALECRRLGGGAAARELIARYRANAADPPSLALLDFYMSHRATVRAKISAWHLRDPRFRRRALQWRSRASSYLADAQRYIRRALRGANPRGERSVSVHGPALEQRGERAAVQNTLHGQTE